MGEGCGVCVCVCVCGALSEDYGKEFGKYRSFPGGLNQQILGVVVDGSIHFGLLVCAWAAAVSRRNATKGKSMATLGTVPVPSDMAVHVRVTLCDLRYEPGGEIVLVAGLMSNDVVVDGDEVVCEVKKFTATRRMRRKRCLRLRSARTNQSTLSMLVCRRNAVALSPKYFIFV